MNSSISFKKHGNFFKYLNLFRLLINRENFGICCNFRIFFSVKKLKFNILFKFTFGFKHKLVF